MSYLNFSTSVPYDFNIFLTYQWMYFIIIIYCADSNAKYNHHKKEGNNVLSKLANLSVLRF